MPTLVAPIGDPTTRRQIQDVVRTAANAHERHHQHVIGPSEIGEDCDRRLTYRAFGVESVNDKSDPWPSIVGIATHGWLADAFRLANQALGWSRYLVEQRVYVTDGISGTADLYDVLGAEVIDHKILGTTSMSKIKSGAIPGRYRKQIHLYGYGYRRLGFEVSRVTLACYPRSGFLDGLYLHTEAYDEGLALAALDRLSQLVAVASILDLDVPGNPYWAAIPAKPGPECTWCPFWRPGPAADTSGCPGPELGGLS